MKVALLTEQERDLIAGTLFDSDSFFNPILDDNDNWIISLEEVDGCTNVEHQWVKNLPLIEYKAKHTDVEV